MREVLRSLCVPDHLGLAYQAWAPTGTDGKVADATRAAWLSRLAGLQTPVDYQYAFQRWKSSFDQPGDRLQEVTLASRLLIGHGNASATGVGLTVQHTWGVPVIPGSALKGLLAHYVDAVYGPEKPDLPASEQPDDEQARVAYQGVTWRRHRIQRGPGEVHRALFGAPDAEEDQEMRQRGIAAGSAAGLVVFHDALYVPGSADDNRPYAVDVLTVHQKTYYDSSGVSQPNDYDRPYPIPFLTVRPGVRILLALSGPLAWTSLAGRLLADALKEWGVGGKTSCGYGRLVPPGEVASNHVAPTNSSGAVSAAPRPRHLRGARITVTRVEDPAGRGKVKFRADDGFLGHFAGEDPPQVDIGEDVEVWVANVNPQAYTLTLRQPKERRR